MTECEECHALQGEFSKPSSETSNSVVGKVLLGVIGATALGLTAITVPFIAPGFRKICLPYIPATTSQVENVLSVLGRKNKLKLIDLGSGDGRIVISAAKQGHVAAGVELNRWLVLYSRYKAWREGVSPMTSFHHKDMFKVDYNGYDRIVVFGVDTLMDQLAEKLEREVKSDCQVIACRFPFTGWQPALVQGEGLDAVWLYDLKNLEKVSIHSDVTVHHT